MPGRANTGLPHRLEASNLRVRTGLPAERLVPYAGAAPAVEYDRAPDGTDGLSVPPGTETAYLAVGGRTQVVLSLRAPITLQRPFGVSPPVRTVRLATDDPDRMATALHDRIGMVGQVVDSRPTPLFPADHSPACDVPSPAPP